MNQHGGVNPSQYDCGLLSSLSGLASLPAQHTSQTLVWNLYVRPVDLPSRLGLNADYALYPRGEHDARLRKYKGALRVAGTRSCFVGP